jgi:alkaline phosphatase
MKTVLKLIPAVLMVAFAVSVMAQQPALPNAHSHNDYNQAVPFYHAFNSGFGSVEADVFLVNGKLLVAHDEKNLQAKRTLKAMYLDPIKKALKKDTSRQLTLLVDIKKDSGPVLLKLIDELKPLRKFCKGDNPKGRLFILISGSRPLPALFKTYPHYIYFDEDLTSIYTPEQLSRIGQISLRYSIYSKWKGIGTIPANDEQKLKNVIDSVHTLGKPIRFWDAPDNIAGWKELQKLHADMLGTDRIDELSAYLKQ